MKAAARPGTLPIRSAARQCAGGEIPFEKMCSLSIGERRTRVQFTGRQCGLFPVRAGAFSRPLLRFGKSLSGPPVVRFRQGICRKKEAVTWCYNPAEGITLFASTVPGAPHKLLLKGMGRPFFRIAGKRSLQRSIQQVNDRECRVFSSEVLAVGRVSRGRGFARPCKPLARPARCGVP
jgi:hypothetical protein